MENELQKHIYDLKEMVARVDERTQNILVQATKTNGRVTKSEDKIDKLEANQATINARVSLISAGIGIVVAAAINFLFK